MPKPINWEQFTQLTVEERAEMKTFVDTYGEMIEEQTGIEFTEDYVRSQIDKNLELNRKAKQYIAITEHQDELLKQYPRPKECPNEEIFTRGYRFYLSDNEQENKALQESLKTFEGQQALLNRMLKDLMEMDIENIVYCSTPEEAVTMAIQYPLKQNLAFISDNLHIQTHNKHIYSFDEPLKTAFNDKAKIMENASDNNTMAAYMTSPLGMFVPILEGEKAVQLATAFTKHIPPQMDYFNLITASGTIGESKKEIPHFRKMVEDGWLNNDIRLKNAEGKYVNKNQALQGLVKGEQFTAEKIPPETVQALKDQLNTMPIYLSGGEMQQDLKKQGIEAEIGAILTAKKGKGGNLAFQNDETYPRKLEYDTEKKQFKVGEPVTELPKAPEKPGFFKRLFHAINSNLFKSEFDRFEKENEAYTNLKTSFEKMELQIKNRSEANAKRQQEFREKNNAEFSKQSDAERAFERKARDKGVVSIGDLAEKRQNQHEQMRDKWFEFQGKVGMEDKGPLRDFGNLAAKQLAGLLARAESNDEMKKDWQIAEVRGCMAYQCVYEMVKLEHNLLGSNAPGEIEQRLNEQMANRKDNEVIPMVMEVMNNLTFKNLTENMTAEHITDFFVNNGARKINEQMAKESHAKKEKTTENQEQKDMTLDEKQKVAKDPEIKEQGTPKLQGP